MKKIIFVSGIQIFPPESGGQLRSANLCRALVSLGFRVEIYSFTGRRTDYLSHKKSGEKVIAKDLVEYVNRNPLLGILQYFFYKLSMPPLWLTWHGKIYLPKVLKNKIANSDSVLLDFPFLYPIANLSNGKRRPVRLNTHNAEFQLYPESSFWREVVKKIEQESFKKTDQVLFCNSDDQKLFTAMDPELLAKSAILPNGLSLEQFVFSAEDRKKIRDQYSIIHDEKVFLFTGSQYLPNTEALLFLKNWAHENAHYLMQEKIVILVAGSVSDTVHDSKYLKITGKVADMFPYFWASDFGLNPIKSGSGTNVKMIEFLAAKRPIVTTYFGARGLHLVDNETCFYFETSGFLEVLKKAASMSEQQKELMSLKALKQNEASVDMTLALKNLSRNW